MNKEKESVRVKSRQAATQATGSSQTHEHRKSQDKTSNAKVATHPDQQTPDFVVVEDFHEEMADLAKLKVVDQIEVSRRGYEELIEAINSDDGPNPRLKAAAEKYMKREQT